MDKPSEEKPKSNIDVKGLKVLGFVLAGGLFGGTFVGVLAFILFQRFIRGDNLVALLAIFYLAPSIDAIIGALWGSKYVDTQ